MKSIIIITCYLFLCIKAQAQLAVSCNKTTSIVFPYAIRSVDRGSRDILVQKAKGVENILQVKAARPDFSETNLSVITADGKLYTVTVNYLTAPPSFNFYIKKDSSDNGSVQALAAIVAGYAQNITGVKDHKFDVGMRLKGLYIKDGVIYYVLELKNKSAIGYDIDALRFFIKDKVQSKRTASQELLQVPLYVYGNSKNIAGNSKHTIVVALSKFTIPNKKLLYVQMIEKNGGRHLQLRINNRKLIQAENINNIFKKNYYE